MSAFSPSRRAAVVERAGHRCEYCHLPTRGQVATFPIDHVFPKSLGGSQELENLALTCPHCNGYKWTSTDGVDPASGHVVRLFDPRGDEWATHFRWGSTDGTLLEGLTPKGRATIERLRINDESMAELRKLLIGLGVLI